VQQTEFRFFGQNLIPMSRRRSWGNAQDSAGLTTQQILRFAAIVKGFQQR